jgi:hypothetical protein
MIAVQIFHAHSAMVGGHPDRNGLPGPHDHFGDSQHLTSKIPAKSYAQHQLKGHFCNEAEATGTGCDRAAADIQDIHRHRSSTLMIVNAGASFAAASLTSATLSNDQK